VETTLLWLFATPTPVIETWVISIAGLPVSIAALSARVAGVSAALATPSIPIAGRSAGVEARCGLIAGVQLRFYTFIKPVEAR
jgi:hypothetical protein